MDVLEPHALSQSPAFQNPLMILDQIHIWQIRLNPLEPHLVTIWQMLSPDEKERANSFHFDRDRIWFILRRGFLRSLISRYVNLPPEALKFSYSDYGKPFLDFPNQPTISFNISHSAGLALFAFSRQLQIGVDVEKKRADIDILALAERFFSSYEKETLLAVPDDQMIDSFFRCWTRKEAFTKAHGEGLSLPLDQFDVSLLPGAPAKLLATRGALEPADQWNLLDIPVDPGFFAALAIKGPIPELQFSDLSKAADRFFNLFQDFTGLH